MLVTPIRVIVRNKYVRYVKKKLKLQNYTHVFIIITSSQKLSQQFFLISKDILLVFKNESINSPLHPMCQRASPLL